MTPLQMIDSIRPVLDRVFTGHTAISKPGSPAAWTTRPLTEAKIEQHVSDSGVRYGCCPIAPGTSTTRLALLDLDSHKGETSWAKMVEAAKLIDGEAALDGIVFHAYRSSGGRGLHLIAIWDEPQDAHSVRQALFHVLGRAGFSNGTRGVAAGQVEVFPKQASVPADGFGNMFVLPLAGKSVFIDPVTWEPLSRYGCVNVVWKASDPVEVVERPTLPAVASTSYDGSTLAAMLESIPNDGPDYDKYLQILFGVHHATGGSDEGLQLFQAAYSSRCPDWSDAEDRKQWAAAGKPRDGAVITAASIAMYAREAGWQEDISDRFEILPDEPVAPATVLVDENGNEVVLPANTFTLPRVRRDKTGRIEPDVEALTGFVRHGEATRMALRHDIFTDQVQVNNEGHGWEPFTDELYTLMRIRLERDARFKRISTADLKEAVHLIARFHRHDSAQEWLQGLPAWDGVERAGRFFPGYLQTEDNDYTRQLGLYLWTALAGRIMDPGCKVDIMPVLVGRQGCRKTSSVKAISPSISHFREISLATGDADFARQIRGALVGEVAELRGLGSRDRESVKALITRTHEFWTPKYKEFGVEYGRRIVLIATTNDEDFLDDPTGNRRYAPVKVGMCDTDAIEADRDQLWAEGLHRWLADGIAWEGLEERAADRQEAFIRVDAWDEPIGRWLGRNGAHLARVTTSEVMSAALQVPAGQQNRAGEIRAGAALRRHGWMRQRVMEDGVRRWYFVNPAGELL